MSSNNPTKPRDGDSGVRERILEAALAILSEDGISALSQIQVARRAQIRQSHLTYYFPRRHDLISAIAERIADGMAHSIHGALATSGEDDVTLMLQRLLDAIAQREHMRMFTGALVEADRDPDVQAILMRETERLQAALAEALGGEHAIERARLVLASIWGMGLYAFLTGRPADPGGAFLAHLASGGPAPQDPA